MGSKCFFAMLAALLLLQSVATAQDVVVSIPPQAYLVERIAGEGTNVTAMIQPGDSPHGYEPTPRQMVAAARARLYLAIGLPFERRLLTKLASLNEKLVIVDISADIPRRQMKEDGCSECGHHHEGHHHQTHQHGGAIDPHVWLSPRNGMRLAVAIRDALRDAYPTRANAFVRNCSTVLAELRELDTALTTQLAPFKGKPFYVFHPAFGYFADHYGLEQIPVEIGGKEPSARQLARLIRKARKDHVRVIFVQRQFATRAAKKLAQSIDGAIVPLDPLERNYLANFRTMATTIEKALNG